ncbi:MAG: hypothetical protein MJZ03_02210 [archaeon]|nr:hypothetical protein [archaeon]
MTSYSLYRGCTIPARLPFIEAATKYTIDKLSLDIVDMGECVCCMEPTGLKSLNHNVWYNVSSYICSKANENIVTLCDGCSISLSESVKESGHGPSIISFLEILQDNINRIIEKVVRPVELKLAVFPGCHCEAIFSKKGKNANKAMSDIVKAIGGIPIIPKGANCCGNGLSLIDNKISKSILSESIESFKSTEASAVVTSCPFCFIQFDTVARFRTYNIIELTAIAMGWNIDIEKFHRGK